MAIGNLNLYDVLVDLVPGTFLIIALSPVFRLGNLSIAQGIGILLAGYVVGRLLHAIGSFGWVDSLRIDLEERFLQEYAEDRKYGLSFRNRLKSYYDDNNGFSHPDDNLDGEIIDSAIERLESEMGDVDAKEGFSKGIESHEDLENSKSFKLTDDVLTLRYFGENYLFDKDTLYLQYEIMSTFYRSLWVASVLGALFYAIISFSNIGALLGLRPLTFSIPLAGETAIENVLYPLGFVLILIVISYISLRQRLKFRFKKTRAFINDLHINLPEDQ